MPIKIIRNDITKIECDAIVNASNSTLLGGGGVDGAIHNAAGKKLLFECMKLGGCKTGQAKITKGYNLPCKYVIHTVGPKWKDGSSNEESLLKSCYKESLKLAEEYNCESVAFPLISSGIYGYPKDKALKIATDTITAFLENNDMQAYIVVFDKRAYQISSKLYADIAEYIDDHYVDIHDDQLFYKLSRKSFAASESFGLEETPICGIPAPSGPSSLEEAVNQLDESFSEMLLRKIDEKGMTDSQCYKNANIDRKLFSKIRNDKFYKPRKTTVLAFALALELPLAEIKEMLEKAGFALSRSNKADVIVEYFIQQGNYNVFEINEALFAFDQQLIGA